MLGPKEEYHDLDTLVRAKSAKNGEKVAVRFVNRSLSYRELEQESGRVASGLQAAGIGHGDRVAAFLFNSPEFLTLWFGLARLGAVLVPLNTALKGDLLRYELGDAAPNGIVVDQRLWPVYAAVRVEGKIPREWVLEAGGEGAPAGVARFAALPRDAPLGPVEPPQPWETAAIMYTSGTTGPPKGVLVPHEGYLATSTEIGLRSRLHDGAVLFTGLPLFHCNAQEMTTLAAIINDLTAAFDERFHASTYWETASAMGATHVSLLIAMINILYKQPEKPTDRQHTVRVALTAGTTKLIWPDFEKRFGVTVIELYGMTECGCTTLMNPPNAIRVGSIGTPLGFVEADVVDDHDHPVPDGERGELIVRPRQPFTMFSGYLNKSEQTVEAWRNLWFHTGDYVTRDADGYYYFIDRKKDVIRRRGENIAPYDVETVLNRHPAVFESVVVPVPSPLGEDDVKAFVQLKPGVQVEAKALFEFSAEHLPFFMVPKYIEFLDEIPKTANQKAQRYVLRGRRGGQEYDRDTLGVVVRKP
jgi:crotonobetaine/carnitine-CoA ligase